MELEKYAATSLDRIALPQERRLRQQKSLRHSRLQILYNICSQYLRMPTPGISDPSKALIYCDLPDCPRQGRQYTK